jgi:acyl carrier protein
MPHALARRKNTMSNEDALKNAFCEGLGVTADTIDWDTLEYRGIEQWDSVAHMQVVAEIEDAFDIMLDIDDVIAMADFKVTKVILGKYDVSFA